MLGYIFELATSFSHILRLVRIIMILLLKTWQSCMCVFNYHYYEMFLLIGQYVDIM